MPANSPAIKVQATRGYGAKVVFSGNRPSDREELTEKLRGEGGQVFVHPSDDLQVIYGQGTAVLELQEQRRAEGLPDLDYIFAPIGGGGLMSGTALARSASRRCFSTLLPCMDACVDDCVEWTVESMDDLHSKSFSPEIKVIGVEPANADDAFRSMRDNKIYPSVTPNTIADGLRTCLGENTFPIIRRYVDRIGKTLLREHPSYVFPPNSPTWIPCRSSFPLAPELVSEEEILDALQLLWERLKMVVEPSGAVAFAGALRCAEELKGKRVGVLISGGNIDLSDFFTHLRLKVATSGRDKQPEYGQQDEEEKIALP